eukprot:762970-Hanusia_phi.AAC.5
MLIRHLVNNFSSLQNPAFCSELGERLRSQTSVDSCVLPDRINIFCACCSSSCVGGQQALDPPSSVVPLPRNLLGGRQIYDDVQGLWGGGLETMTLSCPHMTCPQSPPPLSRVIQHLLGLHRVPVSLWPVEEELTEGFHKLLGFLAKAWKVREGGRGVPCSAHRYQGMSDKQRTSLQAIELIPVGPHGDVKLVRASRLFFRSLVPMPRRLC